MHDLMHPPITLWIDVCDQRRGYRATFEGPNAEQMALDFCQRHERNHAFTEMKDAPTSLQYKRILDYLYPECEHGLSAALCEGLQHYGYDDDERRAYGL